MLSQYEFDNPPGDKHPAEYQRTPTWMIEIKEEKIKSKINDYGSNGAKHDYSECDVPFLGLDFNLRAIINLAFSRQKILTERAFLKIASYFNFAVRTCFHSAILIF